MKLFSLVLPVLALQGCIYSQTGFIRNDSDTTVFVGDPALSSYSKIPPRRDVEKRFLYCLEVATPDGARIYGVPQVSGELVLGEDPRAVPLDAYRKGGPLHDVDLVITDDGLFFDSASEGLIAVPESVECAGSQTVLPP